MLQCFTRRRALQALAATAAAGALPAVLAAQPERGIVGQLAPELDAEFWLDAEGRPTTFSMLANRGRWVHLKCWQSWCPGCHAHGFPALQRITRAFAGDPRVVNVGVQTTFEGHDVNTGDEVRAMQQRYDLAIVMGHDPGRRNPDGWPNTMRAYRTGGTPWHVVVAPSGTVLYDGFGIDAEALIRYLRRQLHATG